MEGDLRLSAELRKGMVISMNLFAGLEKFGIKVDDSKNIFEEEKKAEKEQALAEKKAAEVPAEDTFLLDKTFRCPVCDKVFKSKMVKTGRVKRQEPDMDLRPHHEGIDTLKYKVASCPHCGYTAMQMYFEHITTGQAKLIREQISSSFKPSGEADPPLITYDMAIDRYKLSLVNTMVKKGKTSEKAYTCLYLAWLYRGKAESLDGADPGTEQIRKECKEQEEAFYEQAYEGFIKAMSSEMYPICGMDQCTLDYLLAVMSYHFKKYDVASKCIANVQGSSMASHKMKDKAYDLKQMIVAEIRSSKSQA